MILCGFDLETPQDNPEYGLQPWRAATGEATIKSFAVYSEDKKLSGSVRMPRKELLAATLRRCAERKYTIATWNGMFDVSWLMALGLHDEVKACKWIDGMLLLKRLNAWLAKEYGGPGFGLKAAVAEEWPQFANYGLDEEDILRVPSTEEEWATLLQYNFRDAKFTTVLTRKYLQLLSQEERVAAAIEAAGIPDIALSYVTGIYINTEALDPFDQDVKTRMAVAEEVVGESVEVVRSPKKLGILLFDTWGYEPIKKTPKGAPATDKESLLKLSIQHPEDPRFKGLMDLRKCNTQGTKFVAGVQKSIAYHGENVTRPCPTIAGTYSGRFTYSSTQGKGKKKYQTGIALHQWERGKQARDLLTAPEGFLLAEFDFSGQEMRLMAIESGDEVMLELFESGGDGHAYMGASIENLDYDWVRNNHDTDKQAKEARNLGKFCVLEGQPVLTDRGLVPIEQVALADKVWDGVEWVTHDGAIYQGEKDVIEYRGLWLTPDHIVWLEDGRHVEFQKAAFEGLQIARTGNGGSPVRLMDNNKHRGSEERQKCDGDLQMQVLSDKASHHNKPCIGEVENVQELHYERSAHPARPCANNQRCAAPAAEEMQCNETEMYESKGRELQELWRQGHQVQLLQCGGSNTIREGEPETPELSEPGYRPGRQQRPLRGRKSAISFSGGESAQHAPQQNSEFPRHTSAEDACVSRTTELVAGCEIHGAGSAESGVARAVSGRDTGQVPQPEKLQAQRVWDIANAGPRHRFTVCDLLVSNCNLSLQYRIGVDTIMVRALVQYGLQLWKAKASHMKDTYLKTYKRVPQYWKSAQEKAAKQGYAETRGHRRIPLDNLSKWEQQQTAINYPIQGTGGDMKALGIAVCGNHFNSDMLYGWDLHDALFVYVKDDEHALKRVLGLKQKLSNLPYKQAWGWQPAIPLPVDAKLGKTWGTLKGV